VVGNLLSNAVKYGGAEISVDIATEQRGSDTWVAFTVSDHGLGIPAEDLPHVFDFRWRGSNVRGRVSGAGIGLAAAKRIVEQHGGAIGVESREGQGTTFTVWLPLQPPRTAGRTSHKDTPSTG
jgi:signal transduction histidine kinase